MLFRNFQTDEERWRKERERPIIRGRRGKGLGRYHLNKCVRCSILDGRRRCELADGSCDRLLTVLTDSVGVGGEESAEDMEYNSNSL